MNVALLRNLLKKSGQLCDVKLLPSDVSKGDGSGDDSAVSAALEAVVVDEAVDVLASVVDEVAVATRADVELEDDPDPSLLSN